MDIAQSLDFLDNQSYKAGPKPFDSEPLLIELKQGSSDNFFASQSVQLENWQMAQGGKDALRLSTLWDDAITAVVPGSVHSALIKAGLIPDPKIGLNDAIARDKSFKTWWFKNEFKWKFDTTDCRLSFGGIAIKAEIWLNGKYLGRHEGMFGGPEYDISSILKDDNVLVVKVHPAPLVPSDCKTPEDVFTTDMNIGWLYTVVFNCVYGWHYCHIPALGIWRHVIVKKIPSVKIESPFIATRDACAGEMDFVATLQSNQNQLFGTLNGTIKPDNFDGVPYMFSVPVTENDSSKEIYLRFNIPDPKLWWPNEMGKQNLYRLKLSFLSQSGETLDSEEVVFGIRTIEMTPLPEGPNPEKYNWTFVINGRKTFIKGTNWCTMDPLMDFSMQRYERLLDLAIAQHINILRVWGGGMPETDLFYDLCNRKGIMIMQEWPTAWNSHKEGWQPYEILEETVRLNTLRLRNHPCLVMWGGGNESNQPFGKAIDMMGRYAIELDGTRCFHRSEPWGGSKHDYHCWWGKEHLDFNLNLEADFLGEFGLASLPNYETVQRYLPEEEKNLWPPDPNKTFVYHTPIFNKSEDMNRLKQYSGYFMPSDTMENFIIGSQLAQTTGIRHTIERARTRWPYCTGVMYYKLNENYPAASWACVDWYGIPKFTYYIIQDSFSPLHACVLFSTFNVKGKTQSLPVFLLDDADSLKNSDWQVVIHVYDNRLQRIKDILFEGKGSINNNLKLGTLDLSSEQTQSVPLLILIETIKNNILSDSTFYWLNFEECPGCLMKLPRTKVTFNCENNQVIVNNTGTLPAVAVHLTQPSKMDSFTASDNFFWLEPQESKIVYVNSIANLRIKAWNA